MKLQPACNGVRRHNLFQESVLSRNGQVIPALLHGLQPEPVRSRGLAARTCGGDHT